MIGRLHDAPMPTERLFKSEEVVVEPDPDVNQYLLAERDRGPRPGWRVRPEGPTCPSRELAEIAVEACSRLPEGWTLHYKADPYGHMKPWWELFKRRRGGHLRWRSRSVSAEDLAEVVQLTINYERNTAAEEEVKRTTAIQDTKDGVLTRKQPRTREQEYVVAVTSGTRDDRDSLDQLVGREHPQAKRLSNLTRLQTTARNRSAHVVWLDEAAEVLLYRECERAGVGRPESEDRLTLYRIPLRSAACNRLLEFVSVAPNGYLEERRDTLFASSSAVMAMKALQELFAVELARLRLDHEGPAGIDQAIQQQIARARTPQEDARRRAFRDWHLRQICDIPVEPAPADAARALGYDPRHPPQDLVQVLGACAAYRDEVAYKPEIQGPSTSSRGYIHQYYEFRTVGRQLTDWQRIQLHKTIKNATIKPDLMVVDLMVDTWSYDLPWRPEEIFAEYFDAALHFDQSGTRILWFRLPGALAEQAMPYNTGLSPKIRFENGELLVEIYYSEADVEGSYLHTDPRPWLRELMPVRDGLIAGDLRALYLGWREAGEYWQRKSGYPPAPPGIDTLTPELKALDKFLTWHPW